MKKLWEKRLAELDADNLRKFLGRGLSATAADDYGWTDLHYAAASNLPEAVEALLGAGADVEARADWPFEDDVDALSNFLDSLGFVIGVKGPGELTPLHVAAWGNAREAALALIEGGADIRAKSDAGWTPLHWAAGESAQETALALIKAGADVQAKEDDMGFTPLHLAARYDAWEVATQAPRNVPVDDLMWDAQEIALALIERNADVNAKDDVWGKTPLHYAAARNAGEIARAVIEAGADVRVKDNDGRTPLHDAAQNDAWAIVQKLIKAGAEVEAKDSDGRTPLHDAAENDAWNIAPELIEGDADMQAKDNDGQTPRDLATQNNAKDVLALLTPETTPASPPPAGDPETALWESVKDGEDPVDLRRYLETYPRGRYTALARKRLRMLGQLPLLAVEAGNLREILGRELSAYAVDEAGWSDLHYAAAANLPKVAEALLDAGADPAAAGGSLYGWETLGRFLQSLGYKDDNWWTTFPPGLGFTPLHVAAWGNAQAAALALMKRGANVNAKHGDDDRTPLHWAARFGAQETALALVEGGADIHVNDEHGDTPLHYAAWSNALGIASELIKRGADIQVKNNRGRTPLHYASRNTNEIAFKLIKHGANIHATDADGDTPLHYAALNAAREIAVELIEHGADFRARNIEGATPLHYAARGNAGETMLS